MSEMKGFATMYVRAPQTMQDQQVVPATDHSFESEEYMVIDGFPKIPELWVSSRSVTSSTGARVTSREEPTDVEIEAHSRFTGSGFDNVAGVWRPWITHGIDYLWISPPGLEPHTENYQYRLGKEVIHRLGLRFNPGDYLSSSFNSGIDDALEFSVALVITPRVPAGWTLFSTMDDEEEMSLSTDETGRWVFRYGDITTRIPLTGALNSTPVFVFITNDGATARMWIGTSTRNMQSASIRLPRAQVARMRFMLGKTWHGKATASFTIYEFLLMDRALGSAEVVEMAAVLSSTYGAQ